MAEMIAMLNGIPMNLNEYLTSRAQSAVVSTDYNRNLAGLGAMNPTMPQRRGWQRSGLMPGLSKSAAATFQGLPTNAMSVADQVRANAFASQQYSRVLAGLGQEPAADAPPAVNVNVTAPGDTKASMSMGAKALWAVGGIAVGYAIAKMMK